MPSHELPRGVEHLWGNRDVDSDAERPSRTPGIRLERRGRLLLRSASGEKRSVSSSPEIISKRSADRVYVWINAGTTELFETHDVDIAFEYQC
jgi:hypothetical protein